MTYPPQLKMQSCFDREGGTHVKGRSTRVAQQPGGNSTFSFGWGNASEPMPQTQQQKGRQQLNKENSLPNSTTSTATSSAGSGATDRFASRKPTEVVPAPPRSTSVVAPPPPAHRQSQDSAYSALYCVEGAQVRTRPARKVVAPPGGASSIVF